MTKGYLILVLHAHMPFIRHPEHPLFLEEDWLFEGLTETYLPLLDVCNRLLKEGIEFRLTCVMSPPLCEMLADDLIRRRYGDYLSRMVELCHKEAGRLRDDAAFGDCARMYLQHFSRAQQMFELECRRDVLKSFKRLQDQGCLEILSCAATHGFLPLMMRREAIRAQISIGAANYVKHFGRSPAGMWLPECGYAPGVEEELRAAGMKYFFVDTHGILFGDPRPKYAAHGPVACPNGVAAFARDIDSSRQVWSAKEGYPGDPAYREFYRDLGYDADYDYIRPYLHADGVRRNIGLKYFRITGNCALHEKQPYKPGDALSRVAEHAGNFMFNRQRQAEHLAGIYGRPPVIVSPYDAELFGHWWFEGPEFLNQLMRKIESQQDDIVLVTPSEYLAAHKRVQRQRPSMSTWGNKGYSEVWLNGGNDWIYRHLHAGEERIVELANCHRDAQGLVQRALNQAAREFLLAQSSDWAFIMSTGTAVPYAHNRFRNHIARFNDLYRQIQDNSIDEARLADLEGRDNIFAEIDFRAYCS
ncbi:MAG: DUF1957 domain-containing protein [Planctomycetota bacterium]|nr:DUF1957 domain-containing protein [Planctomycetota bacterium]